MIHNVVVHWSSSLDKWCEKADIYKKWEMKEGITRDLVYIHHQVTASQTKDMQYPILCALDSFQVIRCYY